MQHGAVLLLRLLLLEKQAKRNTMIKADALLHLQLVWRRTTKSPREAPNRISTAERAAQSTVSRHPIFLGVYGRTDLNLQSILIL